MNGLVRLLLIGFVVAAGLMFWWGGWMIQSQADRINRFVPTEATVLSTRIESRTSNDSTTYRPVVSYTYEIDGESFTSERVLPLDYGSSSRGWARGIIAQFEAGDAVVAYVDPDAFEEAFLLPQVSFLAYVPLLFAMAFAVTTISVIDLGVGRPRIRQPSRGRASGYWLRPERPLHRRLLMNALVAAIWFGVGGIFLWHYFTLAASPYPVGVLVVVGVYLLVGMIPLGALVHAGMLAWTMRDAELTTDALYFRQGEPIRVNVSQVFRAGATVAALEVALVQREHVRVERRWGEVSAITPTSMMWNGKRSRGSGLWRAVNAWKRTSRSSLRSSCL